MSICQSWRVLVSYLGVLSQLHLAELLSGGAQQLFLHTQCRAELRHLTTYLRQARVRLDIALGTFRYIVGNISVHSGSI